MKKYSRAEFLKLISSGMLGGIYANKFALAAEPETSPSNTNFEFKKALKFTMVKDNSLSILEKLELLKSIGFDGVEIEIPANLDRDEVLAASKETGLLIPGVINGIHWSTPMSSPDPKIRAKAIKGMETAMRDCKFYGGNTVLLVPGIVTREVSYEQAYQRSQEAVRELLPQAEELGVKIAFENVLNNFLAFSPKEAARYVDEFDSPWVGWYYDIGNSMRYGFPVHWIESLGKRIIKVDIKERRITTRSNGGINETTMTKLTEGSCDWAAIIRALHRVGYSGWYSAEVPGGKAKRLADISQRMDRIRNSIYQQP